MAIIGPEIAELHGDRNAPTTAERRFVMSSLLPTSPTRRPRFSHRQVPRILGAIEARVLRTGIPRSGTKAIRDAGDARSTRRFTDRACNVLIFAEEEARRLNHDHVGSGHLLLGLVREDQGLAGRVLRERLGVQLTTTRSLVSSMIERGEKPSLRKLPLRPRVKRVLEFSIEEAVRGHHVRVGPEHLLVGLLREGEGIAIGVLERHGVSLERMHAELMPGSGRAADQP